jgi:hypothetical protein
MTTINVTTEQVRKLVGLKKKTGTVKTSSLGITLYGKKIDRIVFSRNSVMEYFQGDSIKSFAMFQNSAAVDD